MKKYIYIILLALFIGSTTKSFADECSNSCQISDAPAPVLTEYFTNIETLQSNILEVLSDAKSDILSSEDNEDNEDNSQFITE